MNDKQNFSLNSTSRLVLGVHPSPDLPTVDMIYGQNSFLLTYIQVNLKSRKSQTKNIQYYLSNVFDS